METLEAPTQLGGFNQHLLMRQYNNCLSYSGTHQHEDDAIDTFFPLVKSHEIMVDTKTLITDVDAIGSKSDLNIPKVIQECFHERVIPVSI